MSNISLSINPTGLGKFWGQFKDFNKDILVGDPSRLKTKNKTIIGAINEIKSMINNYKG